MTLSNERPTFLPTAAPPAALLKRSRNANASGRRTPRPAAWVSVAGIAAVVAALWMAFDLPAQDPRSLLVSLTPVAAMKCVSSPTVSAECATTEHAPAKVQPVNNR